MKNAPEGGADGGAAGKGSVPPRARAFVENLRRAGGDADARHRMSGALQTATLRDGRYRKLLDLERAWRRYYADRAAERALREIARYRGRLDNPGARFEHR